MAQLPRESLLVSPAQMAELDRRTITELGVPSLQLMEAAAAACIQTIKSRYESLLSIGTLVLCGPGNNGGDGLAVARMLVELGHSALAVVLLPSGGLAGDAASQLEAARAAGVSLVLIEVSASAVPPAVSEFWPQGGLVVDALFGTGLSREIDGIAAKLVSGSRLCRKAGGRILSVDIPSGVHGGSGQALGEAVSADITVSFAAAKRGHYQQPGLGMRGELVVADIGIPINHWPDITQQASSLLSASCLVDALPRPADSAHKGSFGHVLVVAGGPGKCGAARLCAEAALRGGAGLVTLAIPEALHVDSLAELRPEVMVERVPGTPDGRFSMESMAALRELCGSRDVLAIGPGIGTCDETQPLIRDLYESVVMPAVFDADALNCLAQQSRGAKPQGARIITPHPGESKRLLTSRRVVRPDDRVQEALLLAQQFDCVTVLKGAATVLADSSGTSSINPTGNVGMATAGAGDVLTGVIAALLARGASPLSAACGATYWHGHAGDLAARTIGRPSMLAGDICESLGPAWLDLGGT